MQWFNKVLIKVEIVMSHLLRHNKVRLALALIMELLGMIPRDKRVSLAMNNEGWAAHFGHQL
jgi:hypothetical protein